MFCHVLETKLSALHGVFDVHIFHLGDEVKGARIAVVILVGAVQVMVDLEKTFRSMTLIS